MTVEFNDKDFIRKLKKRELRFLHAVGNLAVNQAVNVSHVDTGLSRNAKHYVLDNGFTSNYGSEPGKDGKVRTPPNSDKGSKPKADATIKVVAPLKYDIFLERKFGIMKKSIDLIRPILAEGIDVGAATIKPCTVGVRTDTDLLVQRRLVQGREDSIRVVEPTGRRRALRFRAQ